MRKENYDKLIEDLKKTKVRNNVDFESWKLS